MARNYKKLTSKHRNVLLKYGHSFNVNAKNVAEYYYQSLEYVPLDGKLGKYNTKQEKWTFVHGDSGETLVLLGDILR